MNKHHIFMRLLMLYLFIIIGFLSCSNINHGNYPDSNSNPTPITNSLQVLEYRPAMGQFVNIMPEYEIGDTYQTMLKKAQQALHDKSVVTLGGFGGYITLSLGEPIQNMPNQRDFRVLGNAFLSAPGAETGNSEPGIVLVSIDSNNNGLPDDEWYELAGSEYYKPETIHNYKKTWYKSDTTIANPFHRQPYFPMWLTDTIIEVEGTLLCSHTIDNGGVFTQQVLDYGYADNRPNSDTIGTAFDLDWAVDKEGIPVQLGYCDFVRIQTAVNEVYPMVGELSTEVTGIELMY